ncbi:MAG: hypothetical protein ACLGXA_08935 [Acidobacteriota bacterium]
MQGLWIAHFNAGPAHGNGIAVLRDGEVLGGDFAHTWIGTYQEEGKQLYARVRVAPWTGTHEAEPVVPDRPVMVTLTGECKTDDAILSGHPDDSEVQVTIEMHKAA